MKKTICLLLIILMPLISFADNIGWAEIYTKGYSSNDSVFVNKAFVGLTPLCIELPIGSHEVSLFSKRAREELGVYGDYSNDMMASSVTSGSCCLMGSSINKVKAAKLAREAVYEGTKNVFITSGDTVFIGFDTQIIWEKASSSIKADNSATAILWLGLIACVGALFYLYSDEK